MPDRHAAPDGNTPGDDATARNPAELLFSLLQDLAPVVPLLQQVMGRAIDDPAGWDLTLSEQERDAVSLAVTYAALAGSAARIENVLDRCGVDALPHSRN